MERTISHVLFLGGCSVLCMGYNFFALFMLHHPNITQLRRGFSISVQNRFEEVLSAIVAVVVNSLHSRSDTCTIPG